MKKNEIDGLIKYFLQLGYKNQVKIFEIQTEIIREKPKQKKTPEFFFANWLEANKKFKKIELAQHKKKTLSDQELEILKTIRENRIKNKHSKKESPKRAKIEKTFFALIKDLREKKFSWREISQYIARYHKTKISYVYLRKIFTEIEGEK